MCFPSPEFVLSVHVHVCMCVHIGVCMYMETRDEHRVSSILFFFFETVSLKDSGTHQLYRLAAHQATGILLLSLFPSLS